MRISWSVQWSDYRLQYSDGDFTNWKDWDVVASPPAIEGAEYVVYDKINPIPRFYRLIK
jgi:hypothetical protein